LPAAISPENEAEGTATQRALANIVGAGTPPGFKIGATGKRMQEYLGLTGPAAGLRACEVFRRARAGVPNGADLGAKHSRSSGYGEHL
jgi:hypothetical protein